MSKTKTLVVIQTVSKIGRIISNIFVLGCTIIIALCLLAIILVKKTDFNVHNIFEYLHVFKVYENYSIFGLYYVFTSTIIFCICLGTLSGFSSHYFRKQLETGHPFTSKLSKELFVLGILQITVPFIGSLFDYGIKILFQTMSKEFYYYDLKLFAIIPLGVFYILASFICKYGTELLFEEKNLIAVNN